MYNAQSHTEQATSLFYGEDHEDIKNCQLLKK